MKMKRTRTKKNLSNLHKDRKIFIFKQPVMKLKIHLDNDSMPKNDKLSVLPQAEVNK